MIRISVVLAFLTSPALAQTIYVDQSAAGAATGASWADAFPDLQSALAAATPGAQIWVAEGTYRPAPPGGSSAASFVVTDGVALYGGFDGTEATLAERAGLFATTILSGDLAGNDQPGFLGTAENSFHVVTVAAGTIGAAIDGFTITAGNADGTGPIERSGGGLFSAGVASARRVAFQANQALRWGGAVHVEGSGATVLEDCTLTGNFAGNDGGAVHQSAGSLSLLRCTLENNTSGANGGALYFSSAVYIAACRLRDNHAALNGGAMLNQHANGSIRNSLFVGNTAALGGAIYSAGATDGVQVLDVVGCTIYANSSTSALGGAGVYSTQTGFHLANTIVWENAGSTGTDFDAQYAGPAKLADYACIQSMSDGQASSLGVGNISADPAFVDPDGLDGVLATGDDDLRLSPGSPCIDAGSVAGVLLVIDLAGLPRIADDPETPDTGSGGPPTVDIGAFEFHSFAATGTSLSVSAGGAIPMVTLAGPAFAGELYLVLGTASGTYPGLTAAGHTLLLNPDVYFLSTVNQPDHPPLLSSFGFLDADGEAITTFALPPGMDPILAGLQAHHACAVISASSMLPVLTTTPFPLALVP